MKPSAGEYLIHRLSRAKSSLNTKHLKAVGWAITALSLGFVVWSLVRSDLFDQPGIWTVQLGAAILCGVILYAVSLFLLARGWTSLVRASSGKALAFPAGLYVYARSQIYKYIPSNVLHYVGRQVLLAKRGFSHAAIAGASLAETLALIGCAILTAGMFGTATLLDMTDAERLQRLLILAGAAVAIVMAVIVAGLARLGLVSRLLERVRFHAIWKSLVLCLFLFVIFFVMSGTAFWLVLAAGSQGHAPLTMAIAVASGAWVLGFITPGASAGLGVREALIIAGLSSNGVPGDQAVLAAIAYRLVTTLGDVLFAGAGFALKSGDEQEAAQDAAS